MKRIEIKIGDRYGRFVVVKEAEPYLAPAGRRDRRLLCRCDCGNVATVHLTSLRTGRSASCGCLRDEVASSGNSTHGMSGSPTFIVWCGIKRRCSDRNAQAYYYYGGRGIRVCDRWRVSFEAFLEDMGERPSRRHWIDRIDNDGHYEPGNCQWATVVQQARNRRSNVMLVHDGQSRCLSEWSEIVGIPRWTISRRISRGWTVEEALSIPAENARAPEPEIYHWKTDDGNK